MASQKRVEDYASVEEWADEVLEAHRDEVPPDPRRRWYRRELPGWFRVMDAAEGIGLLVLALLPLAAVAVAFNSG